MRGEARQRRSGSRFSGAARSSQDQPHLLERAFYISHRTRKKGRAAPERLVQALRGALDLALQKASPVSFIQLAGIDL